MSVTSWYSDSISNLPATYFVSLQMGDNGSLWGSATATAGESGNAEVWSFRPWDSNLDDGLNSGWCRFGMSVNSANEGNVAFSIGGSGTLLFSASAGTAIHSVTVRAGVMCPDLQVDWRNVSVYFYHAGQVVENVSLSSFSASTMSGGSVQESVVVVTPTASDCDGVGISGQIRLQGLPGTYPTGSDLFGEVLIS